MFSYSPFFETLHDERAPVGDLGRGTHYSVLRTITFNGLNLKPISPGKFLDFAVIWDEDHDERVIEVVQKLHAENLLTPVQFIGERKGMLTVLVAPEAIQIWGRKKFDEYVQAIEKQSNCSNDCWTAEVTFSHLPSGIISDSDSKVSTYFQNIHNLWTLGLKDIHWKIAQPEAELPVLP